MSWSQAEQAELRAIATAHGADIGARLDFDDNGNGITVHASRGGDSPCTYSHDSTRRTLLQARQAVELEIARARSSLQAGR